MRKMKTGQKAKKTLQLQLQLVEHFFQLQLRHICKDHVTRLTRLTRLGLELVEPVLGWPSWLT